MRGRGARADSGPATLTILHRADERLFGPCLSMDSWFLMFLPLVTYGEDGEVIGRLARSWEHADHHRTWTFHLRSDVGWHDGRPTTAAANREPAGSSASQWA